MSSTCPEAQTLIIANSKTLCFDSPKEQCSNKYPQFGITANWSASALGTCVLFPTPTPSALSLRNGSSSSSCSIGQVYICSSASPLTGTASCLCAGTGNDTTTSITNRSSSKSASCDSALACFFADSLPLFLSASAAIVIVFLLIVFCMKRIFCPSVTLCRLSCLQKNLCGFCGGSKTSQTSSAFTGTVSTLSSSTTHHLGAGLMDSDTNNLAAILNILIQERKKPPQTSSNSSTSIPNVNHHISALDLQLNTWRSNPLHPHALEASQQRRLSVNDLGTRITGLQNGGRRLSISASALTDKDLENVEQVARIALKMITELEIVRSHVAYDGASPRSIEIIDTPRSI